MATDSMVPPQSEGSFPNSSSLGLSLNWESLTALGIYTAVLLLALAVFLTSAERSVSHHYEQAAANWMAGQPLYLESAESGHGFLYFPQAAILHVPFAWASTTSGNPLAGDVLWRVVIWSVFCWGLWRTTDRHMRLWTAGDARVSTSGWQWRAAVVAGLLSASALRIGQSTLLMGGLMMLAVDLLASRRWTGAVGVVLLATAVKPLAMVLALLMLATHPKLWWRFAAGIPILVLVPVVIATLGGLGPVYAWDQYVGCFEMLRKAARLGNDSDWAQVFGMLSVVGCDVLPTVQTMVRVLAAVGTLAVCWFAKLRWYGESGQLVFSVPGSHAEAAGIAQPQNPNAVKPENNSFGLVLLLASILYLMLFNPRTENSTYCLMAPVWAAAVGSLVLVARNQVWATMAFGLVVLTAGSYEIGKYLTPANSSPIWLAPLCTVLLISAAAVMFVKAAVKDGAHRTQA